MMKQQAKQVEQVAVWMRARRLYWRVVWCLGLGILCMLSWHSAQALSLGDARILSRAGEPLLLDVVIVEDVPKEAEGALVALASPQAFEDAGLEYSLFLRGVEFSAYRLDDERIFLRLSSDKPPPKNRLGLLLTAQKKGGEERLYPYTLVLPAATTVTDTDANSVQAPKPAPAPEVVDAEKVRKILAPERVEPAQIQKPSEPVPAPKPVPTPEVVDAEKVRKILAPEIAEPTQIQKPSEPVQASKPVPTPKVADAGNGKQTTIEIQQGDTISEIAVRHRVGGASLNRMMAAIYFTNADAFPSRNINLIHVGQRIRLPNADAVDAVTSTQLEEVVRMLTEDFSAYRQELARQSTPLPATEPSQESRGVLATPESDDGFTQAIDKLKLAQGGDAAVEETLAQEKQDALIAQRQAELERNIRELQSLSPMESEPVAVAEAQNADDSNIGRVTGVVAGSDSEAGAVVKADVPLPQIAAALDSEAVVKVNDKDIRWDTLHKKWREWLPYVISALVLGLVFWGLVRLFRKTETTSVADEVPESVPAFTPESGVNPLKFSVSDQRFDLSALNLDLGDPTPSSDVSPPRKPKPPEDST